MQHLTQISPKPLHSHIKIYELHWHICLHLHIHLIKMRQTQYLTIRKKTHKKNQGLNMYVIFQYKTSRTVKQGNSGTMATV